MSNVKAGIYGFVVGDTLGVPVEFQHRTSLQNNPVTEMIGYGSHSVPEGTWSDDTSMSLAEMDSIYENNGINYDDIMNKYIEWVRNAKYTGTNILVQINFLISNTIHQKWCIVQQAPRKNSVNKIPLQHLLPAPYRECPYSYLRIARGLRHSGDFCDNTFSVH